MNELSPENFSEVLLAAYADGELDADGRALVERWLAEHPEAREVLRTQQKLSPSNTVLWETVGHPEPTSAIWDVVRQEVEADLCSPQLPTVDRYRGLRVAGLLLAGLTMSGTAAAVIWLTLTSNSPQLKNETVKPVEQARTEKTPAEQAPEPHSPHADPLAEFAVLPIPNDDEVILDRVPSLSTGWLPIGRHPVSGMLELASVEELYLEEPSPSPASPIQKRGKMIIAPGDAPMVYAAKPR